MTTADKLSSFVQRYASELDALFEIAGRDRYGVRATPTPKILLVEASDGWAAFGCPESTKYPSLEDGVTVKHHPSYTLDETCQTYTFGVRILPTSIGDPLPVVPANDVGPRVAKHERPNDWVIMDEERRQSLKSEFGDGATIQSIGIRPLVSVEDGIIKQPLPYRFAAWSLDDPSWLDTWVHASFFWMPDSLPLDDASAVHLAHLDFQSITIGLAQAGGLSLDYIQAGTGHSAANALDQACLELEELIADESTSEETIHQWLFDPRHWLFIHPDPVEVRSKVPFGSKESDFVVRHSDGSYTLVEIEPASTPVFQKKGGELSARFNHAKQQVEDWQRYVTQNLDTVERELSLPDIYAPRGSIIMGRSSDLNSEEKKTRWKHHRLDVLPSSRTSAGTYDDCIARVKNHARALRDQSLNATATQPETSTRALLDPRTWFNRAVTAEKAGEREAAITCVEQSVRLPGAPVDLHDRALRLLMKIALQERPVRWKSMAYYSRSWASIKPEDPTRLAMHAYALLRIGEATAQEAYTAAIDAASSVEHIDDILKDLRKPIDGEDVSHLTVNLISQAEARRRAITAGDPG